MIFFRGTKMNLAIFIVGLFLGTNIGIVVACLLFSFKKREIEYHSARRKKNYSDAIELNQEVV